MYKDPVPVSKEHHAAKRIIRHTSYAFAASSAAAPIFAAELSHIAGEYPIAFIKDGDIYSPVALLSLEPQRNLFVAPDGRWLGEYIPASLRRYPFVLGRSTESDDLVLCVDEASGLLSDTAGEPLYGTDGQPSPLVNEIMTFLGRLEQSRKATHVACATLAKHQLFVPWELKVQMESGFKNVAGLFKINEIALDQLSDEDFLDLRRVGALSLSYAHMISTPRLKSLENRAALQRSLNAQPTTPSLDLNEMFESAEHGGDFVFKF